MYDTQEPAKAAKIRRTSFSKDIDVASGSAGSRATGLGSRCVAACVRCKLRKLKCDGVFPKCSACNKANTECLAKDQTSKRAVPRGYLDEVENKVQKLERRNRELEDLLNHYRHGKPDVNILTGSRKPFAEGLDQSDEGKMVNEIGKPRSYIGGSSGNLYINGVRDSAMSFLGVEIDVSDMNPTELDVPFGAMLTTGKPENPELPPYEDALEMVNIFFAGIHSFMPTLHKPTTLKELDKLYHDTSFTPRPTMLVIFNGIFALVSIDRDIYVEDKRQNAHIIYYQRLCPYLHEIFYHEIYKGRLEVLQAINVMLIYLRVVKKPAAGWLTVELASAFAVEMGLHRNPREWMTVLPNPLEAEMRKRVFWCTLALSRSIANNLGRPSGLREIDCDVDLPILIDDQYVDETRYHRQPPNIPCRFTAGVEVFKLARITGHINELLYAPNKPDRKSYVTIVEQLEQALQTWLDELPAHLRYDPAQTENIAASMMMQAYHENQILIRHPSLDLAPSPPFAAASLEICIKSSYEMINLVEQNRAKGYLDITWPSIQKLMLATLTILYGLWHKRDKAEQEDFRSVKQQMNVCMRIMNDLGKRLTSAVRLGQTIRVLVDATFRSMSPSRTRHAQNASSPAGHLAHQQAIVPQQQYAPQYISPPVPSGSTSPYRHAPNSISGGVSSPANDANIWWSVNWNEYMRSVASDLGNVGDWAYLGNMNTYNPFSSVSSDSGDNGWNYAVI